MCFASIIVAFGLTLTGAFESDIISDLVTSGTDERRALEVKAEEFWQPILDVGHDAHADEHLEVYAAVQAAIAELPGENQHVRDLLSEGLMRLKRADERVFLQAVESNRVASEQLYNGPGRFESAFSFLTGGQNFLSAAIKRFVGGGRYSEKLLRDISSRQGDILPGLRGVSSASGDVLTDCRLSSKLGFDVMKYDIYNKGVPKTPKVARDAADRLVSAAGETRKRFMLGITASVGSITRDVEGKSDDASSTVTTSLLSSMQPLQRWGSGASDVVIGEKIVVDAV
jgi:hypothetical protein